MNTIRDLLARKGNEVWFVDPDASVLEALWIMEDRNIGSVLVMTGERLIGILTDRDCSRKILLNSRSIQETLVSEIMNSPVITVDPDQTCHDAMEIMSLRHVRHLPVIQDEMVVGIISMRDVVEEIIYEQNETIRFWEDLTLER